MPSMELAAEQIAAVLRQSSARSLCVECLAKDVPIEIHVARRAFLALSRAGDFSVAQRACSRCKRQRPTLRLSLPFPEPS